MRRKIYLAGRLQILSFVARRGISDSGGDATGVGRQVRRKPRRLHNWAEPADRAVRDSDSERPFSARHGLVGFESKSAVAPRKGYTAFFAGVAPGESDDRHATNEDEQNTIFMNTPLQSRMLPSRRRKPLRR